MPPDFEAPNDANRDNAYQVQLAASDGSASSTLLLTMTVTDVAGSGFRVRRVVLGYQEPVFLAPVPDGSGRVFVVELPGRVQILTPSSGSTAAVPFLDLTGQLGVDGERGLLGFATAPDFATTTAVGSRSARTERSTSRSATAAGRATRTTMARTST